MVLVWPAIVSYTIFFFTFIGLFLWRRDKEPIRSREWPLTLISVTAAWVLFVLDGLVGDFTYQSFGPQVVVNCELNLWITALFIVAWILPYFLRAYRLYFKVTMQQENLRIMGKDISSSWVYRHKWTLSWQASAIVYFVSLLVFSIMTLGIHFGEQGGPDSSGYIIDGYDCVGDVFYLCVIQGASAVLCMFISIYLLWSARDYYAIKYELIGVTAVGLPVFLVWAITIFLDLPQLPPTLIWELMMIWATFIVSVPVPFFLTFTDQYGSHEGSDRSSLADRDEHIFPEPGTNHFFILALSDPVLIASFQQFSTECFCVENLLFFQEVTAYCEMNPSEMAESVQRAHEIKSKYIGNGAPMELNLDAPIVQRILNRFESGDVTLDIFAEASKKVMSTMKADTYKKWVNSAGFVEAYLHSPLGLAFSEQTEQWASSRLRNSKFVSSMTMVAPMRKAFLKKDENQVVESLNMEIV